MSRGTEAGEPFWKGKSLEQMTAEEWESLCDGCGNCCRLKLQEADTGDLIQTNVVCAYLDLDSCRCRDYPNRLRNTPGCIQLTPERCRRTAWLPETCAYRLVDEGRDLPSWHPLVSGDPATVHSAGISVRGKAISESDLETLEQLLADGFDLETA